MAGFDDNTSLQEVQAVAHDLAYSIVTI